MTRFVLLGSAVAAGVAVLSARGAPERPGLWAGIAVSQPVFNAEEAAKLVVRFALVNDTGAAAEPKVGRSTLLVNGQPLKDSDVIFNNGPRDQRFEKLPAGEALHFTYALGEHFSKPGLYRVQWKGEGYESAAVEFRVLAE
jgi:hypothetical protein